MAKILPKSIFLGIIAAIIVSSILIIGAAEQTTAAKKVAIPGWIKNIATFWSQEQITDGEFASAIEFLINDGVIEVPAVQQASAQYMGNDGVPFDELWDAIIKLQNDFVNIQVTDGITGLQGEQGPPGPQGPQGEQGSVGPQGASGESGSDAKIADHETRISDLESQAPSVNNEFAVLIRSSVGINVNEFWGLAPGPSNTFLSASPAPIASGTINGFLLEVIAPDTLSVDVRLYVDGIPTSIVCTVPAGQLSCSATGSVMVVGISEIALKNEGPMAAGVLRDPSAIITMELD